MSKKYEHIEILDNGIVHYDSGMRNCSEEEVERLNKEYYDREYSVIPEILEDGFTEFPILFDNGPEPIWSSCYLPPGFVPSCTPGFEERFGLKYNIYIPSYNRAGITLSDKTFESFGIENYYLCIDPSQYPEYKKHYDIKHLIIRDPSLKSSEKLELCSSVVTPDYLHGAGGAFNGLLYISRCLGEDCYFTSDDDIYGLGLRAYKGPDKMPAGEKYNKDNFLRCSKLTKEEVGFDFKELLNDLMHLFDKMRNKSFLSLEKYGLVYALPITFKLGTRSYSFYLTDNRNQVDHIGQQNNDIITSLEMAKRGYVNMIFEGYQYNSVDTQTLPGGTSGQYWTFGTLDKGKVLVQSQPNFAKIANVYSRIHHYVDFNGYNKMRLLGAVKKDE